MKLSITTIVRSDSLKHNIQIFTNTTLGAELSICTMSTYQSLPNLLDFFSYFFFTSSLKYSSVTLFALSTVVFLSLSAAPRSRIPVLRQRKWFGSVWYDSMLYLSNSRDILRDGYNKVGCKALLRLRSG